MIQSIAKRLSGKQVTVNKESTLDDPKVLLRQCRMIQSIAKTGGAVVVILNSGLGLVGRLMSCSHTDHTSFCRHHSFPLNFLLTIKYVGSSNVLHPRNTWDHLEYSLSLLSYSMLHYTATRLLCLARFDPLAYCSLPG